MSTFEVKIYKLTIEEHPNADLLELAKVGDYYSIVMKGQFKTGDLAAYIPEAAVVPELVLERMGLVGRLAGKKKNRVKAIKLRKILSQGLVFPLEYRENVFDTFTNVIKNKHVLTLVEGGAGVTVVEGQDVTDLLGITKWESPIPIHMQGEVFNAFGKTLKYDIENLKKYPDTFENNEKISITVKLHGTWVCFGSHPEVDIPVVTSKGMSDKGLAFKFNDANKNNLYVKTFNSFTDKNNVTIVDRVYNVLNISKDTPLYILGEIFGRGIQDLTYNTTNPEFRIFDIYIGEPTQGKYLNPLEMIEVAKQAGIETVPIIYMGDYSKGIVDHYTNEKETLFGQEFNMREGIVIKPITERRNNEIGRVFLKSISEKYLLRGGKKGREVTEFN